MKKGILSILLMTSLLLSCSNRNELKNITDNQNETIKGTVVTDGHNLYPFSKKIIYNLQKGEKESKIYIVANFYKDKIVSIVINARNVTLQEKSGKVFFNIKYDNIKGFLASVVKSLDMEYGISDLKQIFTKVEIFGDASVEISRKYTKMEKDSSASYRTALNDAISGSRLLNDINSIFSEYNLTVDRFWFEKIDFETKYEFIKNNSLTMKIIPDNYVACDITFEISHKIMTRP